MARATLAEVLRALILAALVCVTFEMSGLAAACGDPPCSEDCPTDASGGPCAPNCQMCGCCSLPKTLGQPVQVSLPVQEIATVRWEAAVAIPQASYPGDIFHVPRTAVA